MRLSDYIERQPRKRRKSRRAKPSIPTHAAFVPLLTGWGAALAGLAIAILPAVLIARMMMVTNLSFLGDSARWIFAGGAALLGGGLAWCIARLLRHRALDADDDRSVIAAVRSRRVQPIDPALELGSESLDAPIARMPFEKPGENVDEIDDAASDDAPTDYAASDDARPEAGATRGPTLGELAKRGYEIEPPEAISAAKPTRKGEAKDDEWRFTRRNFEAALIETCEGATCESATCEAADVGTPPQREHTNPEPESEEHRELDLAEFAELPGRNAVWVTGDVGETQAPQPKRPPACKGSALPKSALEKLRRKPPEELSLVEMVERFAAALHDRQEADSARTSAGAPRRDAALAEALKALQMFTERGIDDARDGEAQTAKQTGELGETERSLRDALAKLQDLRGAA